MEERDMKGGENTSQRTKGRRPSIWDRWPNLLDLKILHQNCPLSNPMGKDFDYAREFSSLDLKAVKDDLLKVMTDSQQWWPADFGHYGPLFRFIRQIGTGSWGRGEVAQLLSSWVLRLRRDEPCPPLFSIMHLV